MGRCRSNAVSTYLLECTSLGLIALPVQGRTYFLIAAAQVGNFRLWMRFNRKDVENSDTIQSVSQS